MLGALRWPADVEGRFLAAWRRGRGELPEVAVAPPDHGATIAALSRLAARCDRRDPLERWLARSAASYAIAATMIAAVGTPDFTSRSVALYGRPDDRRPGPTALDAARDFVATTDELLRGAALPSSAPELSAGELAARLRAAIAAAIPERRIEVVLDPQIAARAVAGADRVRLRADARFREAELEQLLQHEVYVHSATLANGRRQPTLTSLGLGAPRTTRTQEGLACLAELITGAADVERLRRVALRVLAIHAGLEGADFIDVFRLFLDAGQGEQESFRSAQRVFRGGDLRGGVVFTKDSAYLNGLIDVQTFLRAALREKRPELGARLFAGRLTLGDSLDLAEDFERGLLLPPLHLPPWLRDLQRLGAPLPQPSFASGSEVEPLRLADFGRRETRPT